MTLYALGAHLASLENDLIGLLLFPGRCLGLFSFAPFGAKNYIKGIVLQRCRAYGAGINLDGGGTQFLAP
jgi:hypothetical protein